MEISREDIKELFVYFQAFNEDFLKPEQAAALETCGYLDHMIDEVLEDGKVNRKAMLAYADQLIERQDTNQKKQTIKIAKNTIDIDDEDYLICFRMAQLMGIKLFNWKNGEDPESKPKQLKLD